MKTFTITDVELVASDLIATNGSTTTLDVKNELRNQGFFAEQAEVSAALAQLDFSFTHNGSFRIYTAKNLAPIKIQTPLYGTVKKTKNVFRSISFVQLPDLSYVYTKRNGTIITTVSLAEANYIASSHDGSTDSIFFRSGHSRNDMRLVFCKITGAKYKDSRVRKIS